MMMHILLVRLQPASNSNLRLSLNLRATLRVMTNSLASQLDSGDLEIELNIQLFYMINYIM